METWRLYDSYIYRYTPSIDFEDVSTDTRDSVS